MKEEVKKIIAELKEATDGVLNISDNVLLEQAVDIYISGKIQESQTKKSCVPATEKQIIALKRFKVKIPANLTKNEAKQLIAEQIEKIQKK